MGSRSSQDPREEGCEEQTRAYFGSCRTVALGVRPKTRLVSQAHTLGSSGNRGAEGPSEQSCLFYFFGTPPRGLDLS